MKKTIYKFTLTARGGKHDGKRQDVMLVGSGILEKWLAMSQDDNVEVDMDIEPIQPKEGKP